MKTLVSFARGPLLFVALVTMVGVLAAGLGVAFGNMLLAKAKEIKL